PENRPPMAAKVIGVAKVNIAVKSGVHDTTESSFEAAAFVASTPSAVPRMPAATANQPMRLTPLEIVQTPAPIAGKPTRAGHHGARAVIGGSASRKAKQPRAMPSTPTSLGLSPRQRGRGSTLVAIRLAPWRGAAA